MGSKPTKIDVEGAELKTVFGTCGFKHCLSSCCADAPTKANDNKDQQVHDITMILRYGKTMTDHEIVKAVRGIVGDKESPKRIPTLKELFPEKEKEKAPVTNEKPSEPDAISVKAAIETKE